MSYKEVEIRQGLPKEKDYYSVAACYDPVNTSVYISHKDPERILSPEAIKEVKAAFQEVGKIDKYYDFLMVSSVAEELAHFVQHVQGELLVSRQAEPSLDSNLRIETYGVELTKELENLIQETKAQVFSVMKYAGNPPQRLVIVDGEVQIAKQGLSPEKKEYFDSGSSPKHYDDYSYESAARSVQSKVLEWWFREKEGLDFDFTFSGE